MFLVGKVYLAITNIKRGWWLNFGGSLCSVNKIWRQKRMLNISETNRVSLEKKISRRFEVTITFNKFLSFFCLNPNFLQSYSNLVFQRIFIYSVVIIQNSTFWKRYKIIILFSFWIIKNNLYKYIVHKFIL